MMTVLLLNSATFKTKRLGQIHSETYAVQNPTVGKVSQGSITRDMNTAASDNGAKILVPSHTPIWTESLNGIKNDVHLSQEEHHLEEDKSNELDPGENPHKIMPLTKRGRPLRKRYCLQNAARKGQNTTSNSQCVALGVEDANKYEQMCDFCDVISKTCNDYCNHIMNEHMLEKWVCSLCGLVGKDKASMKDHLACKHWKLRYLCHKCGKTYKRSDYLQLHSCGGKKKVKRPPSNFRCLKCGEKFAKKTGLVAHLKGCEKNLNSGTESGTEFGEMTMLQMENNPVGDTFQQTSTIRTQQDNPLNAGGIDRKMKEKNDVAKKMKSFNWSNIKPHCTVEKGKVSCKYCDFKSEYRCHFKVHMKRKHLQKSLQCSLCDKMFGIRADMKSHLEKVHYKVRHVCRICGKKFTTKVGLYLHTKRHTSESQSFRCELCERLFASAQYLEVHKLKAHSANPPSYVCEQCGNAYASKYYLLEHQRMHEGTPVYWCPHCCKPYYYRRSYEQHLETHNEHKRYQCQVCGMQMHTRGALNTHMRTHTGERPYACEECKKRFTQKSALTRHKRIHTGEKPFQCQLCTRKFNDASILRRHMAIHQKS
ncbi:zinc finger protein 616 [Lingula anatina]|uniref:Zinc finger protein 616 n=1 Tax=Lingula anatina TaxID=7574 RepID=A0A1S3JVQ0_LINAN|nr:zinc finger protein 616 [Lingula anatina]|eukprot:XP_013414139.1 zinc finger protein 616 [Lingula anatina]